MVAAIAVIGVAVPQAHAAGRPDGRHYELVTPVDKLAHNARDPNVSPGGGTVTFDTVPGNGSPGDESHLTGPNAYLSQRTALGWLRSSWNLPATQFLKSRLADVTPDFAGYLFLASTQEETKRGAAAFYVRRAPGAAAERVGPVLEMRPGSNTVSPTADYAASSADGGRIVFRTNGTTTLLPSDPPGSNVNPALYEVRGVMGAGPEVLDRVDVDGAGAPISPTCGAQLGSDNHVAGAMSADGRAVFFSAFPGAVEGDACGAFFGGARRRIFARIDASATVEVSASECTRGGADPCAPVVEDAQFEAASADGRRVVFSTVDQLVDGDEDASADLYLYDFDAPGGQRLSRVSARPDPDSGYQGFLRLADDGSRLYFVARGVLAANANAVGALATADGDHLYAYDIDAGSTTFVATLDPADAAAWSDTDNGAFRTYAAADGAARVLVFQSAGRITPDDEDAVPDVYRFDAGDGSLLRVSRGDGAAGNAELASTTRAPTYGSSDDTTQARAVSTDGRRILFATDEPLSTEDRNAAADVYEWADGDVTMVSDGQDPAGAGDSGVGYALSADGSTATFTTSRALVPSDRDTAVDVYALRSGDDVEPPVVLDPPPCADDACQGPSTGPPLLSPPVTPGFVGRGNAAPAPGPAPVPRAIVPRSAKARGTVARIRVRTPASGRLRVDGAGVRSASLSVRQAGTRTLSVRLTAAAAQTRMRSGRASVRRVRVTFTPTGGRAQTTTVRVRFSAPSRSSTRMRPARAPREDRS